MVVVGVVMVMVLVRFRKMFGMVLAIDWGYKSKLGRSD